LWNAVAAALAVVLLYQVMHGTDWRQVWAVMRGARRPLLAAACLISTLSFMTRALRWRLLLTPEKSMGFRPVFWANSVGYLGNSFLPARAGELMRSVLVSADTGIGRIYVLTTALSERVMDMFSLLFISTLALMIATGVPLWLICLTGIVLGLLGMLGLRLLGSSGKLWCAVIRRLPVREQVKERLDTAVHSVMRAFRPLNDPAQMARFLVLTLVIWTLDVVGAMLVAGALSLGTLAHSPLSVLLLLTALAIVSVLPSTPGSLGIFQFVTVYVLQATQSLQGVQLSHDDRLSYSLVLQGTTYLVITFWGVIGLWNHRRLLPELWRGRGARSISPEPASASATQ
jgi:uncharacterized protein (TIRG00374 family)